MPVMKEHDLLGEVRLRLQSFLLSLLSFSSQVGVEPCLFPKMETNSAYVFGEWRRTSQLHSPADCAVQLLLGNRERRLGVVGKKAKK